MANPTGTMAKHPDRPDIPSRPQTPQIQEQPSHKAGKGCITKLGEDGRPMDLIVPWTGQIIKGEHCLPFDLITRKALSPIPHTPANPDTRLLDVRWHQPGGKYDNYYQR